MSDKKLKRNSSETTLKSAVASVIKENSVDTKIEDEETSTVEHKQIVHEPSTNIKEDIKLNFCFSCFLTFHFLVKLLIPLVCGLFTSTIYCVYLFGCGLISHK